MDEAGRSFKPFDELNQFGAENVALYPIISLIS